MNINSVIKRCGSPALGRILQAFPKVGEESGQRKLAKAARSGKQPNLLADLQRIRQEAFDLEKFMHDSGHWRAFALSSGALNVAYDVLGQEEGTFSNVDDCAALIDALCKPGAKWSKQQLGRLIGEDSFTTHDPVGGVYRWRTRTIFHPPGRLGGERHVALIDPAVEIFHRDLDVFHGRNSWRQTSFLWR